MTQCYRCQEFGHVQMRCTAPHRCVKCAEAHPSWLCKLGKKQPAKCCHCGGPHPASYRDCPENLDKKKRDAEDRRREQRRRQDEQRRRNANAATTPGRSYANKGRPTGTKKDQRRRPPSTTINDIAHKTHATPPSISVERIHNQLQALQAKKAPGPDGVPNIALKIAPTTIINSLTTIYNAGLSTQYFPKAWKRATIILIPFNSIYI